MSRKIKARRYYRIMDPTFIVSDMSYVEYDAEGRYFYPIVTKIGRTDLENWVLRDLNAIRSSNKLCIIIDGSTMEPVNEKWVNQIKSEITQLENSIKIIPIQYLIWFAEHYSNLSYGITCSTPVKRDWYEIPVKYENLEINDLLDNWKYY